MRGRRTQGCGCCLYDPVGVAWAWRLQEKRRGRPGLSGQAWCYVVGLVFPHVSFPAQCNEWLPTGLWPWPRLKEYTYQGPEYTPQPASQSASHPSIQPACVLASEHSQPSVHLLQTGSVTHCHSSHSGGKNDLIFSGKFLNIFSNHYSRCLWSFQVTYLHHMGPEVKWRDGWLTRGGSMFVVWLEDTSQCPAVSELECEWTFQRDSVSVEFLRNHLKKHLST